MVQGDKQKRRSVKEIDADLIAAVERMLQTRNIDEITCYEKEKQVNRWIDFEDMLTLTSIFLGEDAFRRKIHPDFQYIQLDETQDTSKLQFSFLERLSYPEHNLFFLADDDQSIYGFRGASPEYLLHIQQSFPKVKVYALSENHRSAPNLVTLASKIIGENTHRYEKSVTAKKQSPGKIRFEVFSIDFRFLNAEKIARYF